MLNPPTRSLRKDPLPLRIFPEERGSVHRLPTGGASTSPGLALRSTFTGAKAPDIQGIRLNVDSLLL